EEREALEAGRPDLVDADAQRVDQLLVNLIENAIKYTPSGGAVTVLTWRRDAEVGVTVSDTGPGIPPEDLDHVFDRFFRVDEARRRTSGGGGPGARHLPRDRRGPRRSHLGRERGRTRQRLLARAAGGGARARGAPPSGRRRGRGARG